jgi:hypothetical protein
VSITTITCVALAIAALGALWLTSEGRADARAHDDARARWESRQPETYSFEYSYCSGMCAACTSRITVRRGQVTDVVSREEGCTLDLRSAPTIETIFRQEEHVRTAPMTHSFTVRYDPVWGFPASVSTECPPDTSDCGTGLSVSNFRTP